MFHVASPRCLPYTTACQLTQPVVGYTAWDTALEFGPPSGTGNWSSVVQETSRIPTKIDKLSLYLFEAFTNQLIYYMY